MKRIAANRMIAALLAFVMIAMLLPLSAIVAWAEGATYVLNVSTDMEAFGPGTYSNGASDKFGTDGYFILHYGDKMKLDTSNKTFADGITATHRINFQSAVDTTDWSYSLEFTCNSASTVKIWWVASGDGRRMAIYNSDAEILASDGANLYKNDLKISTFTVEEAGTYYIGSPDNGNYVFRVTVAESEAGGAVERGNWADVAAPVISSAADDGEGNIRLSVSADVSNSGGDQLDVTMYNAAGKAVETKSSVSGKTHNLTFSPTASGTYSFKAELSREGEKSKASESVSAAFVLPLAVPALLHATNKGGGSVEVAWTAVAEAERYDVYCNGNKVDSTTKTSYTVKDLTVGNTCTFKVVAVRGEETKESAELSVKVSAEEQRTWGFTVYGPSTDADHNGFTGNLYEDGYVTVYSEGGKGKIVPASTDGLAFYYTAIPTKYNFTLRATVTVDSWTLSNGQEGFGLMVADRLGESGNKGALWNNQYMAMCGKIEYRYDAEEVVQSGGSKYSMKMGLGVIAKTGVTKKNLSKLEANDTETINKQFVSETRTLEWAAGDWGKDAGTYNIVGNYTTKPEGTIDNEVKTTFILEIQKNNTGYFVTYYDTNGKVLCRHKYYDPKALNKLDEDYVYAGFFAARNARATFSNVELTTILASKDAPAEEKPVTKIDPTVAISSGSVTTSSAYELIVDTNVNGTLKITLDNSQVLQEGVKVTGGKRYRTFIDLGSYDEHRIRVQFTPDPNQDLGEDTVLSTTDNVFADITVLYNKGNYHTKLIYVSPNGVYNGNGTREYPYDLYTAVNNVVPGQTIVLLEGTYQMKNSLRIQRGMDGTEAEPIRMIADPEAATRPVLDFQKLSAGIVHGGDYWYFFGFDVTNTLDGQKGFQVSGHYNVLDQIHTYYNGNTGIQISRYAGTDQKEDWPSHNLILNCDSYCNYDKGFEDADGFAAKLTIGEGNVFDGCVAYNNADDGWDLYAKVETGPIGAVTIRNCVAYSNGFVPGVDGSGNGNGFKLGGESLSGKHVLENSYAFWNLHKGIDSNSCPDIIVKNCVSYNNGSYNVAFYTNNAANTAFVAEGVVSFRDSTSPYNYTGNDNLKGKGTQKDSKYVGKTNYYWQGDACVNSAGKKIKADMFVSLTFSGTIARKADGTIDMQGFLVLNDKAPDNAGATMGGTASEDNNVLPEEGAHEFAEAWINTDPVYHWHECDCGAKSNLVEHSFTWIVDWEPTETTTGQKHEECTECGYKRAAVTTYYEQNQQPGPDVPGPTEPEATQPNGTQPNGTQPGTTGPNAGDTTQKPSGNPMTVILIVVVVVLVGGVAAVILLKKKK